MERANPGTETPSRANTRTKRSAKVLRFTAAKTPKGIAIHQEITAAMIVSSAVTLKRLRISGRIGAEVRMDSPKSPWRTPTIQSRYWTI